MINYQQWNIITLCNLLKPFPNIMEELSEIIITDYEIYGKDPVISILHIDNLKKYYFNKEDNSGNFEWISNPKSLEDVQKQQEYEMFLNEIENVHDLHVDISSDENDEENNKLVNKIITKAAVIPMA